MRQSKIALEIQRGYMTSIFLFEVRKLRSFQETTVFFCLVAYINFFSIFDWLCLGFQRKKISPLDPFFSIWVRVINNAPIKISSRNSKRLKGIYFFCLESKLRSFQESQYFYLRTILFSIFEWLCSGFQRNKNFNS